MRAEENVVPNSDIEEGSVFFAIAERKQIPRANTPVLRNDS